MVRSAAWRLRSPRPKVSLPIRRSRWLGPSVLGSPDGAERMFRYASLSSGLDIVRKVLGQHEIATMQTTAIDQAAGIVNLTTILAHASGEWIASDWPVCAIAETATPHRMGAALTYARRYALFTLVGIAGEDDLDAPDLAAPTNTSSGKGPAHAKAAGNGKLNGGRDGSVHRSTARRDARVRPPKEMLGAEASAELRDRLIAELGSLASAMRPRCGRTAPWPRRTDCRQPMPCRWKKPLRHEWQTLPVRKIAPSAERNQRTAGQERKDARNGARPAAIDKSVLTLSGARRHSRPRSRQVCRHAPLPDLRPAAFGCSPSPLHAKPRARPEGQRRVHGALVPRSPSRGASLRRRSYVVEKRSHRSHRHSSHLMD